MIAVVEYNSAVTPNTIKSVRFVTDMAPASQSDNTSSIKKMCILLDEGASGTVADLGVNDAVKRLISALNNDPQGRSIITPQVDSENDEITVRKSSLSTAPAAMVCSGARALTADQKAATVKVRPAAHRAGQTSFFGNV